MNLRVNTHNKSIKPWFDKNEWKCVYALLFNNPDSTLPTTSKQTRQALIHLNVWKSRVDRLPSAIEGTIIILEAVALNDANYTDTRLRETHSFTIVRFLNICVTSRTKQGSFKSTALAQDIPSWIIEIRNDISHDQKLPSLICLKAALRTCFQWLKTHYWDTEYANDKDFIRKPIDTSKIEALVQVYCIVLTPDYDYQNVVDILIKARVEAELTRRNLKEVILQEIELSLPLPEDSSKLLCTIIFKTFLKRYLTNKSTAARIPPNKLDEIITFLYENKMLIIFIEILLNLSKRYYPEHVLYFYSKVLDRIFNSLHHLQNMKQHQASLIQFSTPNIIRNDELYRMYEFEIIKPTPNIYSSTYMDSFSKIFHPNTNYLSSLSPVIIMESVTAYPLERKYYSKDVIIDYDSIFAESLDQNMDIDLNEQDNCNGKIWSIVKDTSIFQKCALGDFPAIFLETAADALYNYIK